MRFTVIYRFNNESEVGARMFDVRDADRITEGVKKAAQKVAGPQSVIQQILPYPSSNVTAAASE